MMQLTAWIPLLDTNGHNGGMQVRCAVNEKYYQIYVYMYQATSFYIIHVCTLV